MNRRNTKHKCSDSLSVIKDAHIVRQNEKTYMRKEQTVQPSIRRVLIRELKQHAKCTKMKNARAKCAKLSFFICQIRKFVVFLLSFLTWLLKLLIVQETTTLGVSHFKA